MPAQYYENQGTADHHTVMNWVKKHEQEGEAGLEPKKKPGNPLSRYERRKELTYEEQLQYQIELLKRELVKKEAEVLRPQKVNARKGAMPEENDPGNLCRNSKHIFFLRRIIETLVLQPQQSQG